MIIRARRGTVELAGLSHGRETSPRKNPGTLFGLVANLVLRDLKGRVKRTRF